MKSPYQTKAGKLLDRLVESEFRSGAVLGELGAEVRDAVLDVLGRDADPVFITGADDDEPRVNSVKPGKPVGGDDDNPVSAVMVNGVKCALVAGATKILFSNRSDSDKIFSEPDEEEGEQDSEEPSDQEERPADDESDEETEQDGGES
jgi:hypothetical protein